MNDIEFYYSTAFIELIKIKKFINGMVRKKFHAIYYLQLSQCVRNLFY